MTQLVNIFPSLQTQNVINTQFAEIITCLLRCYNPTLYLCVPIPYLSSDTISVVNSSWPSATYMRRDFQCVFPQRPRYGALISVLISPVPHTWGVTNGSLLASPPNSRRSPASLISPAPHICGASRTPILTRVVWKILNVVTNILENLHDLL